MHAYCTYWHSKGPFCVHLECSLRILDCPEDAGSRHQGPPVHRNCVPIYMVSRIRRLEVFINSALIIFLIYYVTLKLVIKSSGGGGGRRGGRGWRRRRRWWWTAAAACWPFQYWGRENYEIWKFDAGNKYLEVEYFIHVPSVISVEGEDTKNILKCLKNIGLTQTFLRVGQQAVLLQRCHMVHKFLGRATWS